MRFSKQSLIWTIAGLAVALLLIFSFASRTTPRTAPPGTPQSQTVPYGATPNRTPGGTLQKNIGTPNNNVGMGINTPKVPGTGNQTAQSQNSARNIEKQIDAIKGVDNPNVVIINDTALVGYKPGNLQVNTKQTKKAITDKLKAADKSIKKVYVTDTAALTTRISKLSTDIANNRNTSGIKNEVNSLMQKIK